MAVEEQTRDTSTATRLSELGGNLDQIIRYATKGEVQPPLVAPALPEDIANERDEQSTNFVSVCLDALQRPEIFDLFAIPGNNFYIPKKNEGGGDLTIAGGLSNGVSAFLLKRNGNVQAILRSHTSVSSSYPHEHINRERKIVAQHLEKEFPTQEESLAWEHREPVRYDSITTGIISERPLQAADIGKHPGLFNSFVSILNKQSKEVLERIQKRAVTDTDIARNRGVIQALNDASSLVTKALRPK